MAAHNAFYAQSGGVTAVVNATACGVIETARTHSGHFARVYAGRNGILGALHEELIDTSQESAADIAALRHTPGGAFGSCRYKLKGLTENRREYERLIEVFKAHGIGTFFYNGGNDSMDTAHKVSMVASELGYPLTCIGVPKTIDNDLPVTDCCPGFGSAAKYVAVSMLEAGLDVQSMSRTSTKVFILEVMGRHAGWLAAACGMAAESDGEAPHIILFPEVPFDRQEFLVAVRHSVETHGFCAIAVSEGLRDVSGGLIAESGTRDAFGHAQLGGVGQWIGECVREQLGYKYHWALADYLQRSARHLASAADVEQAYAVGKTAVELAVAGRNAVMPVIVRESDAPYCWSVGEAPLSAVANVERKMPETFIREDGYGITDACRRYLAPLMQGENYPPYRNGLPLYVRLKNVAVPRKLNAFSL